MAPPFLGVSWALPAKEKTRNSKEQKLKKVKFFKAVVFG
jgi:hypothetical protein